MYTLLDKLQSSFFDFDQPLGMHMNLKTGGSTLHAGILWSSTGNPKTL